MTNDLQIIVVVHLLVYVAKSCPSSITIQASVSSSISCNFQFWVPNGTCTFQKCSYQSLSTLSHQDSWKNCFNECCESAAYHITSKNPVQMIQQCQAYVIYRKRLIIGLAIGLAVSFLAFIIIIIVCCKMEKCPFYKLRKKWQKPSTKDKKQQSVISPIKDLMVEVEQNISRVQLQNHSQTVAQLGIKTEVEMGSKYLNFDLTKNMRLIRCKCCICQQVRPQCFLTCKHYFHIKCLGSWLQKHKICPSCGTKDLRFVHLYCIDCREGLKTQSISKFKSKFKRSFAFRCKECQLKQR